MKLNDLINKLHFEQGAQLTTKSLLKAINESDGEYSKDEIIDVLFNNKNIHIHATPNNIAQFIADIAKENTYSNAIDICCGTGNILYYLQNDIDDLTGIEINQSIADLTAFTIPELKVINADTFNYSFKKQYDLVVGCIPFGMRINFNGRPMRSEEAFLRKALDICAPEGDIIMIVPNSILTSNQYQRFRNELIDYLDSVIQLPNGALVYSYIGTSILKLSKKKPTTINFGEINKLDDLSKGYKASIFKNVSPEEIKERWDVRFYSSQDKELYKKLDRAETKYLSDISEVIKGVYIKRDSLNSSGDFIYLTPKHIKDNKLVIDGGTKFVTSDQIKGHQEKCLLVPGDIVISTVFNELKLYIFKESDKPAIASNNMMVIRSSLDDYILSYLKTMEGRKVFSEQAKNLRTGTIIPHLSIASVKKIRIPILPIEDLNRLGDLSIESSGAEQLELLKREVSELKLKLSSSNEQDSTVTHMSLINDRFDKIEDQLKKVHNKLDTILEVLSDLTDEFKQIKSLPKDTEEKLFKLCKSLDLKLDSIVSDTRTIDDYVDEIKQWLFEWDLLDKESKTFLPVAEYLFDELSKMSEVDYSPFIVQYCRTLENEILKKLFETYHSNGLIGIDRNLLTQNDLNNLKTKQFAKSVLYDKTDYTLGSMNFIMNLLKENGNTLKSSRLLQHFREFAIKYFQDEIFQKDFLNDIKNITEKFRNKAAHPNIMDVDMAVTCRELLRKNLVVFLESIKS